MKGIFKLVFFNMLALLCLIMILEFIFDIRYFLAQPEEKHHFEYVRRMKDPFVNRTVTPEDRYLKHTTGLRQDHFRFVTNRDGLILGPRDYSRQDSLKPCDILFMGGSTTECLFVHDSLRFAYRTGRLLSQRLNKDMIALNGALSGNHTLHTISNLLHTGLSYQPRVLVYMENINDLALLSKTGSYFDAPPSRALSVLNTEQQPGYLRHWFSAYLPNIYRHYTVIAARIEQQRNGASDMVDEFKGYRSMENREDVILAEYVKALKTLHGICEANGVKLVLMTQFNRLDSANMPFLRQINEHSGLSELSKWIPTYIKMNQVIRDFSRQHGIRCIDLDREIPHTGRHIYDQVHVNDAGSVLASEIIAREVMADTALTSLLSQ
jgi:hypothetical protein